VQRAFLVFVLFIAAVSTGCAGGGDGGSEDAEGLEPRAWVESACGSVKEWLESGQATSEEIQSGPPPETLSEARALMVDLFLQFEEVGRIALADIRALPPPGVERGAEFRRDFVAVLDNFRRALKGLADRASNMSIADADTFRAELDDLLADLDAEVATLTRESDALDDKYPDPAIQEPFGEVADCQELAAGAEN
jgi:hypothetical protein